jgi:hypothetical protein
MAKAAAILKRDDEKRRSNRDRIDLDIPGSYVPLKSDQPDDRPVLDRAGLVIRRQRTQVKPAVEMRHTPSAQRRKKAKSARPQPVVDEVTQAAQKAAAEEAKRARKRVEREKQKAEDTKLRRCRECLREKPARAFPDARGKVCLDCGGQPRGRSVRTVSGGLPGLGRQR